MACFNHKTLGEEELACQLERAASAVPNIIKVKLKHNEDERERSLDDIYMNLPVVSRDERDQLTPEIWRIKVSPKIWHFALDFVPSLLKYLPQTDD